MPSLARPRTAERCSRSRCSSRSGGASTSRWRRTGTQRPASGSGRSCAPLPNRDGRIAFGGFYIDDQVSDASRYRYTYQQTQAFSNGFRMVADLNFVSDFDFFTDYERELDLTSTPNILARLEFSRPGSGRASTSGSCATNSCSRRHEPGAADLAGDRVAGRTRRLARPPCTWPTNRRSRRSSSAESCKGSDRRRLPARRRVPIAVPAVTPAPWLDVNFDASYRVTYYTQQQRFIPGSSGRSARWSTTRCTGGSEAVASN